MNIGFVVNDFPVLSESFILRLVRELLDESDIALTIVVTGKFDGDLLRRLSTYVYERYDRGHLSIVHCRSRWSDAGFLRRLRFLQALPVAIRQPLVLGRLVKCGIRFRTILKALYLTRLLNDAQPIDVVHGQFLHLALHACVAKRFGLDNSTALVASLRGFDVTRDGILSESEIRFLSKGNPGINAYLSVSESLLIRARERGLTGGTMRVIYSGLDVSSFVFRLPSQLPSEGKIRLIQIGRLVEKKGIDLTLEMLAAVRTHLDLDLVVVGDGDLRPELEELTRRLDIANIVTFQGSLSHAEVIAMLTCRDVLLVSSRMASNGDSEGIPNVVKEAMAIGCIVVASDHSGLPEIVNDGFSGFVFPEGDVSQYCYAVRKAVANRDQWDAISRNARKIVADRFDSKVIVRDLLKIYREVVANPQQ